MKTTIYTGVGFLFICAVLLSGCATVEETQALRKSIISNQTEIVQLKQEMEARLLKLEKDQEALSKQVVNVYSSVENRDDKIKGIMGKLDELEYQLRTYWAETKNLVTAKKKPETGEPVKKTSVDAPADEKKTVKEKPTLDAKYEDAYKDAFESFQKGNYDEALQRFSAFIESYGETPLAPNAYYWIGESSMSLKNYEKAIVFFQEIIDKYPKSEKAPRAMLSQAEAFRQSNDKKSSMTILKRIIELYPKSEEASIAERKLRNSGL